MKEILLINVTGEDQPGVTSAITSILAQYEANILDIGQAVIHDYLSLGILAEIPPASESSPVVKDILYRAHELGVRVRFQPIGADSYSHWVGQQGKQRHIVTLLARKVSARHISEVTAVAVRHGLNIDNINRLSGRIELDSLADQDKACVEFSARGTPADLAALRADFMELSTRMDIDIAIQEDTVFRRNRRLVCFDMDSTLIEAEVIDELAKRAGVGAQVAAITEAAMAGELDFKQSFARRMALLQGLDEAVLADIAAELPITEGAAHLISTLKKLGYKTAILSGGFNYFGHYLQRQLGIDYVYANELEVKDGKVTGAVVGSVVDGRRKAELLRELAQRENISLEQVIAVGDGANDLPMLSIAGLGIAFRAKPLVKASAKQSISHLGLDAILYLIGLRDREAVANSPY
ncbi:phosphoserine phosphatase SerB [Exilibacterium tricleocarpae]|uniref:Phosphoserine phosphatase n=1 Tax=Exilibacterium tricleocarpae TaxID=2591008 RepID=A0A545T3R5_9GAMM|nr:phosphoserine phosphatase SerB [Exilibacterium tricleocarpae]TQV71844.1 phosphoserine phosphatase SerB [Exilibacterium tricleocarpae]